MNHLLTCLWWFSHREETRCTEQHRLNDELYGHLKGFWYPEIKQACESPLLLMINMSIALKRGGRRGNTFPNDRF